MTMTPGPEPDRWQGAEAYERFMGRWSRELARLFARWLEVPPGRHWLEVGCGTGALTARIAELCVPHSVVAADPSGPFVERARTAVSDPRVRFVVAGADRLPARTAGYDAVVSSLVLNFLPDPPAALAAMAALAAPGGVVGACVWDYGGGMEFLRRFWDAAVALDPRAQRHDEGERFPVCTRAGIESAFQVAGLRRIAVEPLEIETRFRDFDDYWRPFLGGPGPAPGYLESLPRERQEALARRLAATLPRRPDGAIRLTARAWAARGSREGSG